jgi:hypothetical protein
MTDTSSSAGLGARASAVPGPPPVQSEPTGWVGWIVFAAVMMIMIGILHAIEGFVAIFKDSYYLVAKSGLVLTMDYTAWGWTHLILGLVIAGTGAALFTGRMWARIVGVIVAGLSILASFSFASAYPLWAITLIAIDILVIYALVVHGREMREF